jgi:lipoprotein-anchoring transpeptidase ErfK/SrfK
MFRIRLPGVLAALLSVLLTAPVFPVSAQPIPGGVEVAQQDVGVFIDSKGRRVFYDLYTNEILSIEDPVSIERLDNGLFPQAPPPPSGAQRRYTPPPVVVTPAPGAIERAPLQASRPRRLDELLDERGIEELPREEPYVLRPGTPEPESPTEVTALPRPERPVVKGSENVARLQVFLDRKGFSPGVIDGQMGSNVRKAIEAYESVTAQPIDTGDEVAIETELGRSGGPAFRQYAITEADIAGPYIASVPTDYAHKAQLEELAFTSPVEMLAERFHMQERYLRALNPDADFGRAGTVIRVADTGRSVKEDVVRIEADKSREQVRAYDASGRLVAAYPATIGSTDTPSPSGKVEVERIAFNPNYTYNPKINFVQGNNRDVLTIPPGPNGPVGSIWIALSKPTYGIHGTPEPDRIGKTNSHGCVRLTNWDADELARMVTKGVTVEFLE